MIRGCEGSLSDDADHDGTRVRRAPVLKEENALPCAQGEMALHDRNDLTGARQRHAQVAGHVVRAFVGMDEPGCVFGNEPVKEAMQICASGWIGIFINDEAAARVLDKNRGCAGVNA